MPKAPQYRGVVNTLFGKSKLFDTGPQPVKISVGAGYPDLPAASIALSPWEDWYDPAVETSSSVVAGGGSPAMPAAEDPNPGYTAHDKTKLENLIRLLVHCISVDCAPSAESVPAPPGLVLDRLPQAPTDTASHGAPPVPVPEQARPRRQRPSALSGISFGSIGHPIDCAGPCKYWSMKSRGCKDGRACDRCHMCAWPRDSWRQQGADGAQAPTLRASVLARSGTAPPTQCKRMLLSSAATAKPAMHPPEMSPQPPQLAAKWAPELAGAATAGGRIEWTGQEQEKMSPGSVNHPHGCAGACKYFRKSRGCKDGTSCSRCHMCEWHAHPRPGKTSGRD